MKALSIILLILFSQFTYAKYSFCRTDGQFTITNSEQEYPYNCNDIPGYESRESFRTFNSKSGNFETRGATFYSTIETDSLVNKLNTDIVANNKATESLKKRMFDVEQALAQDVSIPDSVIVKIKSDLREELKAELKAEILEELRNSK